MVDNDLGHCESDHDKQITILLDNGAGEKVVDVCSNSETSGEVHFVINGVTLECLEALIDGGFIALPPNWEVVPDVRNRNRVTFYDQDCPLYQGVGKREPTKLAEYDIFADGFNNIDGVVHELVESACGLLKASSEIHQLVIEVVLDAPIQRG